MFTDRLSFAIWIETKFELRKGRFDGNAADTIVCYGAARSFVGRNKVNGLLSSVAQYQASRPVEETVRGHDLYRSFWNRFPSFRVKQFHLV